MVCVVLANMHSFRTCGRGRDLADEGFGHLEGWVFPSQLAEIGNQVLSLRGRQNFGIGGSALRCENAEPDFYHLRLCGPEAEEFIEVARAVCDLRRDGAVNGDAGVFDALEDALVGRGLAAYIMFRLQAIDGYDDVQFLELHPGSGDFAKGAGDDLHVYAPAMDLRDQRVEFTITNEGIASDDGDMERLVFVDNGQYARDQFVAFEIGEFAKLC